MSLKLRIQFQFVSNLFLRYFSTIIFLYARCVITVDFSFDGKFHFRDKNTNTNLFTLSQSSCTNRSHLYHKTKNNNANKKTTTTKPKKIKEQSVNRLCYLAGGFVSNLISARVSSANREREPRENGDTLVNSNHFMTFNVCVSRQK